MQEKKRAETIKPPDVTNLAAVSKYLGSQQFEIIRKNVSRQDLNNLEPFITQRDDYVRANQRGDISYEEYMVHDRRISEAIYEIKIKDIYATAVAKAFNISLDEAQELVKNVDLFRKAEALETDKPNSLEKIEKEIGDNDLVRDFFSALIGKTSAEYVGKKATKTIKLDGKLSGVAYRINEMGRSEPLNFVNEDTSNQTNEVRITSINHAKMFDEIINYYKRFNLI